MPENIISPNTYDVWIARPIVVLCVVILAVLAILNAGVPFGSMVTVKSLMVLIFTAGLFITTLYSWGYFIRMYVGGAVLQGFSFLAHPAATEQKLFFSYFYLNLGTLKIYLADIFLLVALLVICIRIPMTISTGHRYKPFDNGMSRSVAIFVFIGGVIGAMSVHTYGKSALGEARVVWYAMFFFAAAQYFNSTGRIIAFFRFFVFVTLVRSCVNFITVFISPEYLSHYRPFGSNADAAYCALSFLLLVTLGERLIKGHRLRKIALFWLGIFPILITSRSALLCLALTLAVYALLEKKIRLKTIGISLVTSIILGVVTVCLIASVPQLNDLFVSRFVSLFSNYQDDPTGNWRLLGWLFALESIKNNPLFGVGFGGYSERFIYGQWETVSLHNAYMDYLYTMGLFGFLPFAGLLIYSLSGLKQAYYKINDDNIKCCVISLFAVTFYSVLFIGFNAEMDYASSGTVMWIFLGMVPYITKIQGVFNLKRCADDKL